MIFILVGNQDIHTSLDQFEFWSDSTTDYGFISVAAPEGLKNIVSPGFLFHFYPDI